MKKFLFLISSFFVAFSNAAVTFNETNGFTGSLDLKYYLSAAGIIITAICSIWAVKKAISLFR